MDLVSDEGLVTIVQLSAVIERTPLWSGLFPGSMPITADLV